MPKVPVGTRSLEDYWDDTENTMNLLRERIQTHPFEFKIPEKQTSLEAFTNEARIIREDLKAQAPAWESELKQTAEGEKLWIDARDKYSLFIPQGLLATAAIKDLNKNLFVAPKDL